MITSKPSSPDAKPRLPSTLLLSTIGAGVVLLGSIPLLFLFMLLETTEAARSDSLVWVVTVIVGSFVALGVLLIVYALKRSRAILAVVATLALMWVGILVAFVAWRGA